MPLYLQRAHVLLDDPQSALAVAEGAKARSLAVLLAQQRLAASSSSGAARSGGSGDDDGDHGDAADGAAAETDEQRREHERGAHHELDGRLPRLRPRGHLEHDLPHRLAQQLAKAP